MLVKWYLLQCGANAESSYFPAKNASDNIDGADADFVAVFEELKTIFYVQAKHHKNTTDEWAVEQINKYKEQKEDDVEYHHIPWVISTCEKFSEKAVNLAVKNKVRLINGLDFAELLLNAGLRNIDKAF
jgi:hypothetical protein